MAERTESRQGATLRRARVDDVPGIAAVMARYVEDGTLLPRSVGELYRSVPEFHVAVDESGRVIATAALRILWSDLGEVRSTRRSCSRVSSRASAWGRDRRRLWRCRIRCRRRTGWW